MNGSQSQGDNTPIKQTVTILAAADSAQPAPIHVDRLLLPLPGRAGSLVRNLERTSQEFALDHTPIKQTATILAPADSAQPAPIRVNRLRLPLPGRAGSIVRNLEQISMEFALDNPPPVLEKMEVVEAPADGLDGKRKGGDTGSDRESKKPTIMQQLVELEQDSATLQNRLAEPTSLDVMMEFVTQMEAAQAGASQRLSTMKWV